MKVLLIIIAILNLKIAIAQEREIIVPGKIKEVTLFMQGAQVARQGEITLEKGTWTLVFSHVSPHINSQSIQLSQVSQVNLLSVQHRVNYLADESQSGHRLKDSIQKLDLLLTQLSNARFVLDEEISLLQANKKIAGEKGFDITQLEELQDLFRKRLTAIKDDLLRLSIQEKKYREMKLRIEKQLQIETAQFSSGVHQVVVTLQCSTRVSLKPMLTYFVQQAGWTPEYDIRVKDLQSNLVLIYKANVWQETGEEWEQVNLKLSTGNPNLSGAKPTLGATYINIYDQMALEYKRGRKAYDKAQAYEESDAAPSSAVSGNVLQEQVNDAKRKNNNQSVMEANATSMVFNIASPYTIPSGSGRPQIIEAQYFDMPAQYQGMTVPKLDPAVFWVATVTGREELNQLNGMANVYFQGVFTGQSQVQTIGEDSLFISLGRDLGYIVERKRVKEMTTKGNMGSSKKEYFTWEITVRNTRNQGAEVVVEDQIPLSKDENVTVELLESSGGQLDVETGKIIWKPNVPAGGTVKIKFSYTVKYPKGKKIMPH